MTLYSSTPQTILERQCVNPDCVAYREIKEFAAFSELGAVFLRYDHDAFCRDCGEQLAPVA